MSSLTMIFFIGFSYKFNDRSQHEELAKMNLFNNNQQTKK